MKNLRFYNKEGYPYNFQYNETDEKWEGKLIFDPNSSDLYKTIGLYVFENVEPIEFSDYFNFNKFELYNDSGITFRGETKQNLPITAIQKTNDGSTFYTKWIYGKAFHQFFPVGTIIKFQDIVGTNLSDFNSNNYFNVLSVKNDAILISTATSNNNFDGLFTSGYISSYNVIKYPDYKRNLSISSKIYTDKKLSIVNSEKNDGVLSVKEYSSYKRAIYDYSITGQTNQFIELSINLYTDRPILYTGDFTISGSTFIFSNPIGNFFKIGQNITFENYNNEKLFNGNYYTVQNIETEKLITNKSVEFYIKEDEYYVDDIKYYAKFYGNYNLKTNDIIYFNGNDESINDNKDFKILDVVYDNSGNTTLQLEQLVHTESGYTLNIIRKLKSYEYDTISTIGTNFYQTVNGQCYLTNNTLTYKQQIIRQNSGYTQYEETIKAFGTKYNAELNRYGINTYYYNGEMIIEGLYEFININYFNSVLWLKSSSNLVLQTFNTLNTYSDSNKRTNIHYLVTNERLYNEIIYLSDSDKLSNNYYEEILFNLNDDTRDYGFTLIINDVEYYIPYNDISGNTTYTQETIIDFVNKYGTTLYNKGINIYTGTTVDNKLYLKTLYPNVEIVTLKVIVNNFSSYQLIYKDTNDIKQKSIIISGNQLDVSPFGSTDLFNVGLSTGMVISITGSTYNENDKEYNILGLSNKNIQLSYQGKFFNDISKLLTITSREYIRKPRISYNKDIYYEFSWINTYENKYDDSMFFYDITGDQLKPPKDTAGNYITALNYIGQKPLFDTKQQNIIRLNKEPNSKLEWVNNPKYQQTIFDTLTFALPQLDSNNEYNYLPEPFQVFVGYNTTNEGVNTNVLSINKIEYLTLSGITGLLDNYFIFYENGTIEFKSNSFNNFNDYGFEVGQFIQIKIEDTDYTNQILFENYEIYKIINVYKNKIIVDIKSISKIFKAFNTLGKVYNYNITVQPKEIGRFVIYGETETEDERFDVNLRNLGININKEEELIFRDSDIEEYGVDYSRLNNKRKEMLIVYPDIYNYIGSYKSLINAINYFGYNDLELYEYYKNVNKNSPFYKKYFRIHIPDMFDNSVEGWTEYDYIKSKGNRNNYQRTNLFNLTYNITDENGTNLNLYSLKEVQTKIQKLKLWLRNNILPLSTNIVDITGSAKLPNTIYRVHDISNVVQRVQTNATGIVVNFNYIATLNFNTNYLFTINFYTIDGSIPESFELIVKTFSKDTDGKLIPVQYFKLLKDNLDSFNFSIDKLVDPYIYIETANYGDYGVGIKNNKMFYYDEPKSYTLVNNNFKYRYYPRIATDIGYYIIDDDGQLWIVEDYKNS